MDEFNDFDILLDSLKEKNENAEKGILNKAREQPIRECAKGYVSKIKTLNLEAIKQRSATLPKHLGSLPNNLYTLKLVKYTTKPHLNKSTSKIKACVLPKQSEAPDGMISLSEILRAMKLKVKLVETNYHSAFSKFIQLKTVSDLENSAYATLFADKTNFGKYDKLSIKIASGFVDETFVPVARYMIRTFIEKRKSYLAEALQKEKK